MQLSKLKNIIPANVYGELESNSKNITSNFRLAHFLSQVAHESGNFRTLVENLNYSAAGLLRTFPRYFTPASAQIYARKPEMIGNRVYANRMGNGSENSGMGYLYRGRGYLQLTGRSNYYNFGLYVGEDCVAYPDLVSKKYPLTSALWFFERNNLWPLCDGDTEKDVINLTKRINGGTNGLRDRLNKFRSFMKYLNA